MIKVYSAVILSFLLVTSSFSFAQSKEHGASKTYSGYFHQSTLKSKGSFWQQFFGKKPVKQEQPVNDRQCFLEFKSPVSFAHQPVIQVPDKLAYVIRFEGHARPFEKFIIKIYSNDDQEYEIDPNAEGKQVGINEEHHIFDTYLIYLILGQGIDHIEIVSPSGDSQGKYVLDKSEIRDVE